MIWCIHGFLGRGADWHPFLGAFAWMGFKSVQRIDLFAAPPEDLDLPGWGAAFAGKVAAVDPAPVLLGYSLGGRLALHALLHRPHRWKAAVIVSAHPGLECEAERAERRKRDSLWAGQFETEPWEPLLRAWDSQAVFGKGRMRLERPEAAYDRAALCSALKRWSLGTQKNLLSSLGHLPFPVLWFTGGEDERFTRLGEAAVQRLPEGILRVVKGASHRVPWEAPHAFIQEMGDFFSAVTIRE